MWSALVITGAAWLLAHFAVCVRALRSPGLSPLLRLAALVPGVTPWVGFRAGARVASVLWCVFAVAYLVLRSVT
ncbi:MAG TPA: hypothetical protein VHM19_11025 [Polyangiales bacterium]|nr:hypothetical protein [Polyangiales bacterium]